MRTAPLLLTMVAAAPVFAETPHPDDLSHPTYDLRWQPAYSDSQNNDAQPCDRYDGGQWVDGPCGHLTESSQSQIVAGKSVLWLLVGN